MSGAKEKASHSHESALGSILGGIGNTTGNLVSDIVDTAENVPSGLLKIATTNPVDTAKAIGADYKTRYGSLFSGDFGKFAHQVGQHPLSYLLDAGTVATGGAGALAKAGILSKDLSTTSLSLDRAATAEGLSAKVPVNLSRNPFTRQVQKAGYKIQSKLPENIPVLGENAAASRGIAQEYQHNLAAAPKVLHHPAQGDPMIPSMPPKAMLRDAEGKLKTTPWTPPKPNPDFVPASEEYFLGSDAPEGAVANIKALRDSYKTKYGDAVMPSLNKYAHRVSPSGPLGKSTEVWKDVVLAGRPAWQVQNIVTNTGMAASVGGVRTGRGIAMATKGELDKAAQHFEGSMETFGGSEKSGGLSRYKRVINKSYNFQGKFEKVDRKAVMYAAAMKVPEVKAAVRHYTGQGMSEGDALAEAFKTTLKGEKGAAIHREIRGKIDDAMGDYTRYTAAEQRLKKVVPFYGWNRHASRHLYAMARDRPGQLLAFNQISKIGQQAHDDWGWKGTPDFMKGYVKIGGHTFDTAPFNPLKGATDSLKSVKEVVSGNPSTEGTDLAGNLNPFISSGIQALTGKSLLTGAPIKKTAHGLLGSLLDQTVTGLPQWKLAMKAVPDGGLDVSNPHTFLTPTGQLKSKFKDENGHVKLDANGNPVEAPGRHMINSTFQSLLASFAGIPDKGTVNIKTAQTVAKKVETDQNSNKFHAPKKRKKKASFKSVTSTQSSSGWGASSSNWGG